MCYILGLRFKLKINFGIKIFQIISVVSKCRLMLLESIEGLTLFSALIASSQIWIPLDSKTSAYPRYYRNTVHIIYYINSTHYIGSLAVVNLNMGAFKNVNLNIRILTYIINDRTIIS